MEISPSSSLITALSDYTESRSTQADEARQREQAKAETQQTSQSGTSSQRVEVSSERELQAARDAAQQADEQAVFRREAPTAGVEERYQPPGQIVDISV